MNDTSLLILPSKVYDVLKPTVQVILPATATFYATLGSIWGFPSVNETVATIVAITTLLGVVLGISSRAYNRSEDRFDGNLNVSETDASQIHQLEIKTDPEVLSEQDRVTFRVNRVPGSGN